MSTSPITADLSQPGAHAPAAPAPTQAPAPGPHSRLLRMIQGLAVGVGAFADSAATQGREGGPEEVQAFQSEQQKQQMRAQESQQSAQRAQRENQEGDLRMKTMNANLLMQQAAYHHALQMYPSEEKGAALDVLNKATASYKDALAEGYDIADPQQAALWRSMQQSIISIPFSSGQSQQEVLSSATDAATKAGKNITDYVPVADYNDGKHGTGGNLTLIPAAGLQQVQATPRQIATGMAQMKATLDTAKTALGPDDQDVKSLGGKIDMIQRVLDQGGKPSAYDFIQLNSSVLGPLSTRIGGATQRAKLQKEQGDAAKAGTDAIRSAQEADPAFQVKQAGAKKGAEVAAEIPFAGKKAAAEAAARQPYEVALKNLEAPIAAGVQNDEQAKKEAEKYTQGYVEKMGDISELKNAVGQAQSGNVAAAKIALIKLAGISMPTGSKRLSPEAIYQLDHMGSDAQKWIGSIKNALTGDKWTSGMAKDITDWADNEAMKARTRLSMGVHTLNAVRGTKIDPDAISRAANQDQDWSQQVDSPSDGPTSSATPAKTGGGLASKWGAKKVPPNQ